MKNILVVASTNPGKTKEIKEILKDIPFEIKSLSDFKVDFNIAETGKSFEENAIIKAKIVGEKTGYLTIGEDSGLEVDALDGRPGIMSARYCLGKDLDRINKLLKELLGVPKEKRTARYKAVVAIYNPKTRETKTFEGTCEGLITQEPMGVNGFGYDPVFLSKDLGKTNGEATFEEKNRVSHRARAIYKLKKFLLH